MDEVSTIGLDVAKPVFQMHGVDAGHPRAEELPSLSKAGGATRATDRDSNPPRGLIIPWNPTIRPHVLIS